MNNVSLSLNSSSKTRSTARRLAWAVGLALCLLASNGLWAASEVLSTCYNCEISAAGSWDCESGGVFGGTKCTVSQGSCTVEGDCGKKSNAPVIIVDIPIMMIQDVAGVDGGAAATLVRLRQMQSLSETVRISWLSADISSQDVASLLAGGEIGSKTPGELSHFEVQVVLLDEDNAALVLQPSANSHAQAFSEVAIFLERDPATGVHHARNWFLH